MPNINKARFWTAVLYPENMREDWETTIGDIVQYPYAYCQHNRDKDAKSEHRKDHVHLILAFPNTTTYKHAMGVFNLLSAEGKIAVNTCQAVIGIRNVYDYLIHDTETCRKQGKQLYDASERITGNNFDIGSYEQISTTEKREIFMTLSEDIARYKFTNYLDFYLHVVDTYDDFNYIDVVKANSGHFERLTKSNFFKWWDEHHQNSNRGDFVQNFGENNTKSPRNPHAKCCPNCGSVEFRKDGKTAGNTQRFECKACGKKFV